MKSIRLNVLMAVLLGGVMAGQAPQPAQPPPDLQMPSFKVQVDYVEVDAVVTDEQGNFVANLTKDDFQVFEDGRPQTVSTFAVVNIPVEQGDRPLFADEPIEPDVETNERPFDGRIYVMILDDLHVAATRTQNVKNNARRFIERNFGANDLMAVIHTGGRTSAAQEFTNNKRLLLDAVDKFMGRKLVSATLARNAESQRIAGTGIENQRVFDPNEQERVYNAQGTMRVLREVGAWFGSVRGRKKAMLFFSEGIDYDVTDLIRAPDAPVSSASTILQDIREAIQTTARSNVSIYGIDPRGLAVGNEDAIEVTGFDVDNDIRATGLTDELRLSQDNLRALSEETNGFAVVNRNDFAGAFDRIVRDNSRYYVLAYYPATERRDGRFHRIQVRVNRPGLTVRARRGYLAPRGNSRPPATKPTPNGPSPALAEALNSPIQVSGLTMRAFAAPFKSSAPNASVVVGVEVSGRDIALAPNNVVELSYIAVDVQGKQRSGKTDKLTLNLKPETRDHVAQTGLRFVNRIDLPPGRYQLRVATHDTVGGASGSVVYDLEIPDFYKQPFTMSGLVLTSMSASSTLTVRPDEQLKGVLPASPVAVRTFPQNDEMALFTEVYDNEGRTPHTVDIVATVRSDEGTIFFKNEEERSSKEFDGQRGGFGYTTRIPLTGLKPGPYVLTVEARSRLGDGRAASRQVRFHVEAR
jgi:VWFA-related protein